jgi:hypothetical protein
MGKFTAKLIGESDGYIVTREFADAARAKVWLQGEGLADFDDQTACGEIRSESGDMIWRKSHLQAPDRADRDEKAFWIRIFARANFDLRRKN